MSKISEIGAPAVEILWQDIAPRMQDSSTLQDAASAFLSHVYQQFEQSLILARVFVTLPYGSLPEFNRAFVDNLAQGAGVADQINDDTPVLSLVSTRGSEAAWNDIRQSQGHVGIPLVSSQFVSSIPMLSRLLDDLGLGTSDAEGSGAFHVPDARQTVDDQDRKIIPMQDFVEQHGVHSVIGVGKAYGSGSDSFVVSILFTNENIPKEAAIALHPIIEEFANATQSLLDQGKIFNG